MSIPFSRAAWESWQDIYAAIDSRMMECAPLYWGCPNNPFVITVHRAKVCAAYRRPVENKPKHIKDEV